MPINMFRIKYLISLCFTVVIVMGVAQDDFRCVSQGRFPDPEDCGSFYDCIENPTGGFLTRRGSCKGNAYDFTTGNCVEPSQVPDCKPRGGKSYSFRQQSTFDHVCASPNVTFTCGTCESLVQCVDGKAFEEYCGEQFFCQKLPLFGGVCRNLTQDTSKNCSCDKVNAIKSDPYDKSYFYHCDDTLDRAEYRCPAGMSFNVNEKICENPRNVPACEKMGTFVVPENCSIYYTCIQTPEGWLQTINDCPSVDLFYNKTSGICEDACLFGQGDFKCVAEGRFGDPSNCYKYFECLLYAPGEFTQIRRACPRGYSWSDQSKLCVAEGKSACIVKLPSVCTTPAFCLSRLQARTAKITPGKSQR